MRRTGKQRPHTLADIDALIDSTARARLRRAVQDAARCPTPASFMALDQEWPHEWVVAEEAVYGVTRDRCHRSPTAEAPGEGERWPPELMAVPGSAAVAEMSPGCARAWSFWKSIWRKCFRLGRG
jgi:hypothetical protein